MKIRSVVDWLVSRVWILIIVSVLLLAVYVAIGRQALSFLPEYRLDIANFISEQLNVPITIDAIYGEWDLLSPNLIVKGVVINPDHDNSLRIPKLDAVYVEVDVLATLINMEPRFGRIHIDGLRVGVQRDDVGEFSVLGLNRLHKQESNSVSNAENNKTEVTIGDRVDFVLEQRNIIFTNVLIDYVEQGRNLTVLADEIRIGKREQFYELQALLSVERESVIRLEMTAIFQGRPDKLETLKGEAYLNVLEGNFASWLPEQAYQGLQIGNIDLSTELWADFAEGKLFSLLGNIEAKHVTGTGVDGKPLIPLDKISAKFIWLRDTDGDDSRRVGDAFSKYRNWRLEIHRLDVDFGDERWRNRKVVIASHGRVSTEKVLRNVVDVEVSAFSIGPIVDIVMSTNLLTAEQLSLLADLSPAGGLNNTKVKLVIHNHDITQMNLRTNFENVSSLAKGEIPGFENLSGYVDTTLEGGVIEIDALDPTLDLTAIMRDPISGSFIKGPLRWEKNEEGILIETGIVYAQTKDIRGEVMASLQLYQDKSYPLLQLHAGLFEGDGSKISTYLPAHKLKKALLSWLDNGIASGHIVQGDILYNGPVKIDPNFQTRRTMQLRFQVDNAEVDYVSGWPKITDGVADVLVRGRETEVDVVGGHLLGAHVDRVFIQIPKFDIGETPRLQIKGSVSGELGDGIQFLRESPLHANLSGFIDDVTVMGEMKVDLDLDFPLSDQNNSNDLPMKTDVWVKVSNGDLQIRSANINVDNVKGELTYNADKGLNAAKLTGRVFNRRVVSSVHSSMRSRKLKKLDITVDGSVDITELNAWAKQPILDLFSGEARYQSEFHFWAEEEGRRNSVDVRSDLRGVSIDMPPPLFKSHHFPRSAEYSMTLGGKADQQTQVSIQYGEDINMVMGIDDVGVERGKLSFSHNKAVLPNHPGILVDGHLDYVDVDEWADFFGGFKVSPSTAENRFANSSKSTQRSIVDSFRLADLHVGTLEGFGQVLHDVNGQVMYSGHGWLVALQNKTLSALFRVPGIYLELEDYDSLARARTFPDEVIDADFIYLRLPADGELPPQLWEGALPLAEAEYIDPLQFPPFNVRIRELMFGDDSWGEWRAKATLTDKGVLFKDATAEFKHIRLKGDVLWEKNDNNTVTEFTGLAITKDVAKMTKEFGYDPTIVSKDGKLEFAIHWPGAPTDFELSNSIGNMVLAIKNGQLLSVDNAASSMRVIGLLNFETLGRRLKLDFGDLYKRGLSFDSFGGNFAINKAVVKTDNFSLKGPSTQLEIKGTVNIDTHQLNQEVGVTLPVGRNLVLPAAVVGGLPLAATLYVVDKALGDQINKLTTIRFNIVGDWDDPQMSEVKFFK